MRNNENSLKMLTIKAYRDEDMRNRQGQIEAMYNPSSIDLSYHLDYSQTDLLNDAQINSRFTRINPGRLRLELIFDSTFPGNITSVDTQLGKLRQLTTKISPQGDKEYQGSPYLKVTWGKMQWHEHGYFAGRLVSLSVRYSLFDRNAAPIRATASLELVGLRNLTLQNAIKPGSKPPIPSIPVPDLSPLPMVAGALSAVAAAAGVAAVVDYLSLAEENELDNLDDYDAGDTLVNPAAEDS